jgi:hypothetical protein
MYVHYWETFWRISTFFAATIIPLSLSQLFYLQNCCSGGLPLEISRCLASVLIRRIVQRSLKFLVACNSTVHGVVRALFSVNISSNVVICK